MLVCSARLSPLRIGARSGVLTSGELNVSQNQMKAKQSRQFEMYLVTLRPKPGMVYGELIIGLVALGFALDSDSTCFWLQSDQAYLCLAIGQKQTCQAERKGILQRSIYFVEKQIKPDIIVPYKGPLCGVDLREDDIVITDCVGGREGLRCECNAKRLSRIRILHTGTPE